MPRQKPVRSHRSTLSLQKTEITIHVYDLLPPGRIASTLWFFGTSLLHSGVVISGKEYAFGGHDRRGVTGVYWTKPKTEPPGGTFRCEILHGFTLASQDEIDAIIRVASDEFQGTAYNLLTKNCNHFTALLCERLTGRASPSWLNRAAGIGVALPCVVPRDWIEPPDFLTTDGELVDEDEHTDERSSMLRPSNGQLHRFEEQLAAVDETGWNSEDERQCGDNGKGKDKMTLRDSSERSLPAAEHAPRPSME